MLTVKSDWVWAASSCSNAGYGIGEKSLNIVEKIAKEVRGTQKERKAAQSNEQFERLKDSESNHRQ